MIIDPRTVIDRHLAPERPLSDGEWTLVQSERWQAQYEPAGIAAKVQQWRDASQHAVIAPVTPKFRADPARTAREDLLSHLFSLIAARLPLVEGFRRDVLGGKLLKPSDVGSWIEDRARTEKYTVWLEVPVRPDEKNSVYLDRLVTTAEGLPATDFQLKWLNYILPGQKSQRVPTAAGGVLDRLRLASEQVAAQTGCSADYATTFILSGEPLPFFSCTKTVVVVSTDLCSALNRIELKIDPTLSPRQVSEVYRQLRAEVFGRRYRAMSEKHIRLALFAFSRPQNEALKNAMAAWNKLYPKWGYRQESNFGRDRIVARRRALATLAAAPTSQNTVEAWLVGDRTGAESPAPARKRKRRTR
jgi:hypothetical protein